MGEVRQAVTLTSSGQKIFTILHLPEESTQKKFPAVLFLHGFGGNKSGKSRLAVRLSEKLSQVGIASLRFDFRGAGDSEGEFQDTTIAGLLQDARITAEWLLEHPLIDQERFGILGRSLGGMLSIFTAACFPNTRALVLWAPVFDAQPWLSKTELAGGKNTPFEHQGVPLNPDFIRQFAALQTREELQKLEKVPLLHIQGENDKSIEKYHVEQYEALRKPVACETKFIQLLKSDHEFSDPQEQESILQETVAWFQKYLR